MPTCFLHRYSAHAPCSCLTRSGFRTGVSCLSGQRWHWGYRSHRPHSLYYRRAKEKSKQLKASKGKTEDGVNQNDSPDADVEEFEGISELPSDRQKEESSPTADHSQQSLDLPAHPRTAPVEQAHWDSFESPSVHGGLLAKRRGSLPVDAFPSADLDRPSPPLVDAFDPYARRLSVDASLARLANHPYAPHARARNGALFATRPLAAPPIRQRPFSRSSHHPPRISGMPYSLDTRRASLGNFRQSPRSALSPSPSPLVPYATARTSLPEHDLYVTTSRPTMGSPIPGPLPSPNFSFGAANTPSMASASSGDSERNSPDSLQAFPYRETDHEDDDGLGHLNYPQSRFGSIASVATSDSSIQTPFYTETPACYPEIDYDPSVRRDSW
jgi:hypothetical protein